jgi:hypothetical protein
MPAVHLQATMPAIRPIKNSEAVMKARITDHGRFLGLDFADWSMLLVGFALAGFLSLYI